MINASDILYEDNHLIAINKASGTISQGDKTGDLPIGEMVKDYLKAKYNKPGDVYLGVVHRLDRPVSGIMLFAKTSKAAERLSKMIQERSIQKTYLAATENRPEKESGRLIDYLLKNQKLNKSFIVDETKAGAKKAILEYKVVGNSEKYTFLSIQLITGRHHQIRAQLAGMGCIIKGDLKYGARRSNKDASIHLHAHQLRLIHPIRKEEIIIEAPLPKDIVWQQLVLK